MSEYYTSHRSRNLYVPGQSDQFKLSRSKIDLFLQCPRCFYLDRRLGTGRPPGFPFALNSAVDQLLKQEFDIYRAEGKPHPLQEKYGLDLIPAKHDDLNIWRENFKGLQFYHEETGFVVTGAIDDLWINENGEYLVVDYKATAKQEAVTELNQPWQDGYKRQMEVYQWLLRKMGYHVSDTGYFVYCTGKLDREAFDGRLDFDVHLIGYEGKDDWVEEALRLAKECLDGDHMPDAGQHCDYCAYILAVEQRKQEHASALASRLEKKEE